MKMAFNLIAESKSAIEWEQLLDVLQPIPDGISFFPIPSSGKGIPDAIGISLLDATEEVWYDFVVTAESLWSSGLRTFSLYLGTEVTADSLTELREAFLE